MSPNGKKKPPEDPDNSLLNAPQLPVFTHCSSPPLLLISPSTPPPSPFHPVSLSCSPSSSLWNYPPLPPPYPTVPCLGTGLSSEVTLTLARALPLNPISRARYWQPARGNRYGGKVFFFVLFFSFIYSLDKRIVSG